MPAEEIPRQQWGVFCDTFTRQHHLWLITLRVERSTLQRAAPTPGSVLARDVALEGVTAEENGAPRIWITTSDGASRISHRVDRPVRLMFRRSEQGAHEGLLLEDDAGLTTAIEFRGKARPEMVDGLP